MKTKNIELCQANGKLFEFRRNLFCVTIGVVRFLIVRITKVRKKISKRVSLLFTDSENSKSENDKNLYKLPESIALRLPSTLFPPTMYDV